MTEQKEEFLKGYSLAIKDLIASIDDLNGETSTNEEYLLQKLERQMNINMLHVIENVTKIYSGGLHS